jgi:hypothetical protein
MRRQRLAILPLIAEQRLESMPVGVRAAREIFSRSARHFPERYDTIGNRSLL